MFGEKVQNNIPTTEPAVRLRGWFPRRCAVEWIDSDGLLDQQYFNSKKSN